MAAKKVLIVGGGVAGCTAAYWLSKQPDVEVSLYSMGWKLGGKGSSGRNPVDVHTPLWRSEEHGPHVWTGGYFNSLRTCRAIYGDFFRQHASHGPFDCAIEDPGTGPNCAFRRASEAHFFPDPNRATDPWVLRFPGDPDKKDGDPATPPPTILEALERIYRLLRDNIRLLPMLPAGIPFINVELPFPEMSVHEEFVAGIKKLTIEVAQRREDPGFLPVISLATIETLQLLNSFSLFLFKGDNDRLFMPVFFDYMLAVAHAICAEIWRDGKSFDQLNGRDYQDLLHDHGASRHTVHTSPFVRSFYDASFAYTDGTSQTASMEAGSALRAAVWVFFAFNGAYLYKMQAGMGEVIFSPIYETTSSSVDYRFFHELEDIHLSADGSAVEALTFRQQVRLKNPAVPYHPLIKVPPANDMLCWPHEPLWDQLDQRDVNNVRDPRDLERPRRFPGQPAVKLEAGRDFDLVIFALPPAVLTQVGGDLFQKKPALQMMAVSLPSVATASSQLWITGQAGDAPVRRGRGGISELLLASAGPGDLDIVMDYSPVLKTEGLAANIRHLLYLCGTISDLEVRLPAELSFDWLQAHGGDAFPSLAAAPGQFDFTRLFTLASSGKPPIQQQYARYNREGSERYVLSAAGTWRHRPATDGSGISNLLFAGDWTRTGIDLGCVESAVTSGMLAAEKASGADLDVRLPLIQF